MPPWVNACISQRVIRAYGSVRTRWRLSSTTLASGGHGDGSRFAALIARACRILFSCARVTRR